MKEKMLKEMQKLHAKRVLLNIMKILIGYVFTLRGLEQLLMQGNILWGFLFFILGTLMVFVAAKTLQKINKTQYELELLLLRIAFEENEEVRKDEKTGNT